MYLCVTLECVISLRFHDVDETGHSSTYHVARDRTRPAILTARLQVYANPYPNEILCPKFVSENILRCEKGRKKSLRLLGDFLAMLVLCVCE